MLGLDLLGLPTLRREDGRVGLRLHRQALFNLGSLAGTGNLRLDLLSGSGIVDGANNPEAVKVAQRRYYEKNKEKILAKARENRDGSRAASRRYYAKNREKKAEYKRKWLAVNRERLAARVSKYRAENPEKYRAKERKKYAANPERYARYAKKKKDNLDDCYVAHVLRMATGDVPKELLEAKRTHLLIGRLIKEKTA